MGMIGIIPPMGSVKKNPIMLVDFALEQERQRGLFRLPRRLWPPLLGALPSDLSFGTGAELAPPVGHRDRRGA